MAWSDAARAAALEIRRSRLMSQPLRPSKTGLKTTTEKLLAEARLRSLTAQGKFNRQKMSNDLKAMRYFKSEQRHGRTPGAFAIGLDGKPLQRVTGR